MGYHYDPILCMNVPDSTSKAKDAMPSDLKKAGYEVGTVEKYGSMYYTLVYNGKVISTSPTEANIVEKAKRHYANRHDKAKDASWKAWTLYIDGKWVKSFNSSMAPIKEAQKFMKENYPGKVGKLVRNTGSSSGYSISGSEYKDAAPADVRDAKTVDENYIVSGMKSQLGQMLKRYKDPKNRNQLVSQYIGIVNNHRANGKVTEEEFNEFVKYAKGLVGGSHDSLDRAIRTADKFTVWESDEYDDIYISYEGGTYVLYVENRPQADGSQQKMIQLAKQEERMRD